jgi:hypothetical protein
MEALERLNEAIKTIIDCGSKINEETNEAIFKNAPAVVHQRFCSALVAEYQKDENKSKTVGEVKASGRALKIIDSISLMEEFYPELKGKV